MPRPLYCSKCGINCTGLHYLCDRMPGQWCVVCFKGTPCGKGKHGEGCPTQVLEDDSPVSEEAQHD